ncbi:MAG TPA: type VI secretion system baseplate subunit TssG [Bryobacteraceae bacterium]|nr:type VI secretion system baseplate subunit TssG [Bryobacteraceae bacterium]
MAPASGTENPDVALAKVQAQLFGEPYTFDFFQAVRVLGWLQPGRAPVGRYSHPKDEVVRFGANPILHFPPSAIHSITRRPDAAPLMVVNFMGLIGPLGALPNYITELIASRLRARDSSMLAFLDIFNHRLTSFFYQAWEKNHFTVAYERDHSDPLTACLYSLIGFGTPGLRNRQPVEDEAFIYYSGIFSLLPKSALALESVLGDYFDIPVEVEPFVGVWRILAEPDHCVFESNTPESTQLGLGAVVGEEIWDQGSRVRLKLGPLSAARYADFLPTGSAWPALRAIARSFCGNDLEFEVQLILRREEVPACQLRNPADNALCLGWHTWLKSRDEFDRNPGDTILLI